MTKPPLHEEAERLILNTGPLIALGRIDALEIVSRLPLTFTAPVQVAEEIATGIRLGHPVAMPTWVEVTALKNPLSQDAGRRHPPSSRAPGEVSRSHR